MSVTWPTAYRRFAASTKGVGAIEFALFAPVLAIMILGVADTARVISTRLTLQQAVNRALEKAAVGTVQTDYQALGAEVATAASIPVGNVEVDAWLECDRARQSLLSGSCEEGQMVSRYVRLTARKDHKLLFPLSKFGVKVLNSGPGGTMPIKAESALRVQ
jgi:Flp pilus assembly pilin Flp